MEQFPITSSSIGVVVVDKGLSLIHIYKRLVWIFDHAYVAPKNSSEEAEAHEQRKLLIPWCGGRRCARFPRPCAGRCGRRPLTALDISRPSSLNRCVTCFFISVSIRICVGVVDIDITTFQDNSMRKGLQCQLK